MKNSLIALALITICTASTAFGQGAAVIIKQRAKEAAGRPLNLPPPSGGQPAAGAVAPQAGAPQPNVSKVLADLAVIKSRPQATQEQKDKLATDLGGIALGANKPADDALQNLANSLADALAGKKLSAADQTALAHSLAVALNAAGGSPQFRAALQGVQDALVLANANDGSIQTVTKALTGLTTKAK